MSEGRSDHRWLPLWLSSASPYSLRSCHTSMRVLSFGGAVGPVALRT